MSDLVIRPTVVGGFQENAYLLMDPETKAAVLVDPGDEADRLLDLIRAEGAKLEAIWLTHAHPDHIGGIAGVKRVHDVPVHLHPLDRPVYDLGSELAANYGLPFEEPPPPDAELSEGQQLSIGNTRFEVVHTPGHSPGHVVFIGPDVILGGDLLFAGSIGAIDLPFADAHQMTESLERVATWRPDLIVYPGHGPSTTIARELLSNPFLSGVARPLARR